MLYDVEFIGGPYDGHKQQVNVPIEQLKVSAELPVSRDVFRFMDGHHQFGTATVTSTALYLLEIRQGVCRYQFVASMEPNEIDIERWLEESND